MKRIKYTDEQRAMVQAQYPICRSLVDREKLQDDMIQDEKIINLLQGDAGFVPGDIAYTVLGHDIWTEDGKEYTELRVLESWNAMCTSSEVMDNMDLLPLTFTFRSAHRAALLAARIAYLDEHYFPQFGVLIARVEVNPDGVSTRLVSLLLHDTAPAENVAILQSLVEGSAASLDTLPVATLQPEVIVPDPVTDAERAACGSKMKKLYDLAAVGATRSRDQDPS